MPCSVLHLIEHLLLLCVLVWCHNVALVGLHHEQLLAQRATALAQHLVRGQRDDGGKGEDEGVDVPVWWKHNALAGTWVV